MTWTWRWWLPLALLVAGAILVIASTRRADGRRGESPEQILKRRYASGEIDRGTYERMLGDLNSPRDQEGR